MSTFAEWTRLKNDAIRERCDIARSNAPLKYQTFAPEYLATDACVAGNASNCRVVPERPADADALRTGTITNLRDNQRAHTNHQAYGIVGAFQGSGPLLHGGDFATQTALGGSQSMYRKSCDVVPAGTPIEHQLDAAVLLGDPSRGYAERLPPRRDEYVSTRVVRRNEWARVAPACRAAAAHPPVDSL